MLDARASDYLVTREHECAVRLYASRVPVRDEVVDELVDVPALTRSRFVGPGQAYRPEPGATVRPACVYFFVPSSLQ